jgi:hypothetical protein
VKTPLVRAASPHTPPNQKKKKQATVGDPAVDAAVDAKAASVEAWAASHVGRRAVLRLALYEQAGGGGGGAHAARPPWEVWALPLAVVAASPQTPPAGGSPDADPEPPSPGAAAAAPPPDQAPQLPGRGRAGLEAVLLAAAGAAAAPRAAVPPVLTPAVATFPFTIDLVALPAPSSSSSSSFSLGAVKRLLLQASPPSVLH